MQLTELIEANEILMGRWQGAAPVAKLGQQGVEPRAGVVVLSPTIATESAGPNYAALEGPK